MSEVAWSQTCSGRTLWVSKIHLSTGEGDGDNEKDHEQDQQDQQDAKQDHRQDAEQDHGQSVESDHETCKHRNDQAGAGDEANLERLRTTRRGTTRVATRCRRGDRAW